MRAVAVVVGVGPRGSRCGDAGGLREGRILRYRIDINGHVTFKTFV